MDAILEISDDGKRGGRQPHRNPIQDSESLARKITEIAELLLATTLAPGLIEKRRHAVQDRTDRPRQQHEPDDHTEHVAMRRQQGLLDRQPGHLAGAGLIVGRAAPFADQLPRAGDPSAAQAGCR
jgi:hypothetical protein